MNMLNADPKELDKFSKLAEEWWNPNGKLWTLHALNPLRLQFIEQHTCLNNARVLDVGCGGGLLAEVMCLKGAQVTGLDLSEDVINAAKQHAQQSKLDIEYQHMSIEAYAEQHPHTFDIITCLEMLEHVPNPEQVIKACSKLVKPSGVIFFSTISRTLKAYVQAILAGEYILKMLPRGTHDYKKFITPAELSEMARRNALSLMDTAGITYQPFTREFSLCTSTDVNYLAVFKSN